MNYVKRHLTFNFKVLKVLHFHNTFNFKLPSWFLSQDKVSKEMAGYIQMGAVYAQDNNSVVTNANVKQLSVPRGGVLTLKQFP